MKKLILVKEIYIEAFKDWTQQFLIKYFKTFSWVCLGLWAITVYAFVFRLSTGFAF
jgi:hypothetical protein